MCFLTRRVVAHVDAARPRDSTSVFIILSIITVTCVYIHMYIYIYIYVYTYTYIERERYFPAARSESTAPHALAPEIQRPHPQQSYSINLDWTY